MVRMGGGPATGESGLGVTVASGLTGTTFAGAGGRVDADVDLAPTTAQPDFLNPPEDAMGAVDVVAGLDAPALTPASFASPSGANLAQPRPFVGATSTLTLTGAGSAATGRATPAAPICRRSSLASRLRSFSRMRSVSPLEPFLSRSAIWSALSRARWWCPYELRCCNASEWRRARAGPHLVVQSIVLVRDSAQITVELCERLCNPLLHARSLLGNEHPGVPLIVRLSGDTLRSELSSLERRRVEHPGFLPRLAEAKKSARSCRCDGYEAPRARLAKSLSLVPSHPGEHLSP